MKKKPKATAGKKRAKTDKLSINKETLESLSDDELDAAKGGRVAARTVLCSLDCGTVGCTIVRVNR